MSTLYWKDTSGTWTETLTVPKHPGFISCFFGPTSSRQSYPHATAATALPAEPAYFRYCLGRGYSWLRLAARYCVAGSPLWQVSHSESQDFTRGTNCYGRRRKENTAVHFPAPVTRNCSSTFNWCKASRQDCKVLLPLLKETLQRLLQCMIIMWFLKPKAF